MSASQPPGDDGSSSGARLGFGRCGCWTGRRDAMDNRRTRRAWRRGKSRQVSPASMVCLFSTLNLLDTN
uniref:Uncharacterized protein n=1 Tax=Setaria viridis TaxID=4556 RepID=A0A4U6T9F8_SETVI|nr:hypothetical protein SEVIR_9G568301v2 [Setaria viridis]